MFHRKEINKDEFWSVLLYISYYFALKMFIAYLIASAARWLIARGLGVIKWHNLVSFNVYSDIILS